jgi:tagatose-1,6-bisphosphate aldolase non-catalytic subunit AgaZ/GatZ
MIVAGVEQSAVKILTTLLAGQFEHVTLLAVCPNSTAVTTAALQAAKEANAPILFAATLNQVDRDGGYTSQTPQEFVTFVEAEARRVGYEGPLYPCLDHGGPWLKDAHAAAGLSLDETMAAVKQSVAACLDAGYALLHVDPTVDLAVPAEASVPVEQVVERTLEIMKYAEAYRRERGIAPVAYEVGTEEVHGGLADVHTFDRFLSGLDAGLKEEGLQDVWPCFVVGKVGTDLHTTHFEPQAARALTERVKPYGALLKGHYTDYVDNPEAYPLSGMGGANVGPEFTEEEYAALMDLSRLEQEIGRHSGLPEVIRRAVVESGRWKKWLLDEEQGRSFDQLDPARQEWLVRTGSRYVWTDPDVESAREHLYQHLADRTHPEAYVLWRIKTAVMKYFHAFNLIDLNDRLAAAGFPAASGVHS